MWSVFYFIFGCLFFLTFSFWINLRHKGLLWNEYRKCPYVLYPVHPNVNSTYNHSTKPGKEHCYNTQPSYTLYLNFTVFHQCPFCVPESHIYLLFIFSLDNFSVKKIFFMILTFLKSTGHYHMEYPSIWFVFSCLEWGYVCLLGARIPKKLVMSFPCTKSRGS